MERSSSVIFSALSVLKPVSARLPHMTAAEKSMHFQHSRDRNVSINVCKEWTEKRKP